VTLNLPGCETTAAVGCAHVTGYNWMRCSALAAVVGFVERRTFHRPSDTSPNPVLPLSHLLGFAVTLTDRLPRSSGFPGGIADLHASRASSFRGRPRDEVRWRRSLLRLLVFLGKECGN
jgi:hypothetical protein